MSYLKGSYQLQFNKVQFLQCDITGPIKICQLNKNSNSVCQLNKNPTQLPPHILLTEQKKIKIKKPISTSVNPFSHFCHFPLFSCQPNTLPCFPTFFICFLTNQRNKKFLKAIRVWRLFPEHKTGGKVLVRLFKERSRTWSFPYVISQIPVKLFSHNYNISSCGSSPMNSGMAP